MIIKIIILYFMQITHTDDFPSTGTLLVQIFQQEYACDDNRTMAQLWLVHVHTN